MTLQILVVDDEPAARTAVQRALRLDGYDVELAADGAEALAALASASRDAVLLDVLMPGIDGLEVCRQLRRRGDHTPVLMLTARDGRGRPGRRPGCRRRRLPGQACSTSSCRWSTPA